ncbi:Enolase, partial [Actinidia chinensis var. chinensis]
MVILGQSSPGFHIDLKLVCTDPTVQLKRMASRTLRRRLHHGDVGGKKHEHFEASGLEGLDEPLLGNYDDDGKHSEGNALADTWDDERKKEHLHWTLLFSQLIAQWAQWLANIVVGSGTFIGRLFPFHSTTQNGQTTKLLLPSLSPLQ